MDRMPVHHSANTERKTTVHTHIYTYGQFKMLKFGLNIYSKDSRVQTGPRQLADLRKGPSHCEATVINTVSLYLLVTII